MVYNLSISFHHQNPLNYLPKLLCLPCLKNHANYLGQTFSRSDDITNLHGALFLWDTSFQINFFNLRCFAWRDHFHNNQFMKFVKCLSELSADVPNPTPKMFFSFFCSLSYLSVIGLRQTGYNFWKVIQLFHHTNST
jgi:hypothetical protein